MTDNQFWSLILKGVGAAVAVVGAWLAFEKYLGEKRVENDAALLEARKPLQTKRQEVYDKLVSATSLIANNVDFEIRTDPDGLARQALRKQGEKDFWFMYWGSLPMVADENVARFTDEFENVIYADGDGTAQRNASMNLARACRVSLGFSYDTASPLRAPE